MIFYGEVRPRKGLSSRASWRAIRLSIVAQELLRENQEDKRLDELREAVLEFEYAKHGLEKMGVSDASFSSRREGEELAGRDWGREGSAGVA